MSSQTILSKDIYACLDLFMTYLTVEKNMSHHTTENYYLDLIDFFSSFSIKHPEDVTYLMIRRYLSFLQEKGYARDQNPGRIHP